MIFTDRYLIDCQLTHRIMQTIEDDARATFEDMQVRYTDKLQEAKRAEADRMRIASDYATVKTQLDGIKVQLMQLHEHAMRQVSHAHTPEEYCPCACEGM